jgi:hypothetical protein
MTNGYFCQEKKGARRAVEPSSARPQALQGTGALIGGGAGLLGGYLYDQ